MSDKLDETYEIRLSSFLKSNIQKFLTKTEKDLMLVEVRNLMARHIHNCSAKFDPIKYQNEE